MAGIYVGVDPGNTGGLAAIVAAAGVPVTIFADAPTIKVKGSTRTKTEPDEPGIVGLFRKMQQIAQEQNLELLVAIEKVAPMPSLPGKGGERRSMGASSAFGFGMGFGMWRMACTALGIPYQLVHPATWKKLVLAGTPKDAGSEAIVAGQLYPHAAADLRGPKGGLRDGRVDALLIAHWLRRTTGRIDG